MKQKILYTLLLLCLESMASAQEKGDSWNISAGVNFPVGTFSETHWAGIAVQGEYSRNRFGKMTTKPKKNIDYFLSSGADFYFGKKETVSSYPFTYSGYFILNSNAGILCNTGKQSNIRLGAGPALSIYKKNIRFNISSAMSGSWFVSKNTGITAGLQMLQETGARPLWAIFTRISRSY